MATEEHAKPTLITSRIPVGPKVPGEPGTVGDTAFKDAVAILIGAWVLLFLIYWSLRRHNA